MAQASHAATAVLHLHASRQEVKEYLEDWQNMRKNILTVSGAVKDIYLQTPTDLNADTER
jgi:peptidyl-tRNA hydrolase